LRRFFFLHFSSNDVKFLTRVVEESIEVWSIFIFFFLRTQNLTDLILHLQEE
jgi:hypothetical protein